MKNECHTCHDAFGMEATKQIKEGQLAAGFLGTTLFIEVLIIRQGRSVLEKTADKAPVTAPAPKSAPAPAPAGK